MQPRWLRVRDATVALQPRRSTQNSQRKQVLFCEFCGFCAECRAVCRSQLNVVPCGGVSYLDTLRELPIRCQHSLAIAQSSCARTIRTRTGESAVAISPSA